MPDSFARGGIEGGDTAAESAALIRRIDRGDGLVSTRHRDVQSARIELRRSGDDGHRVIVGPNLPEKRSRYDVEGVDIAAEVAEVYGSTADDRCNADPRRNGVTPISAARPGVESIGTDLVQLGKKAAPRSDDVAALLEGG